MNTKTITPIHVCDLIAHETVSLLSVLDEDAVPPAQWMRDGLALYAAAHQLEEETARHLNWIDDEIQRIRQTAAGQELILLIGDEQLVRTAGLPMQIEAVRELLHTTAQLESVESRTALLELVRTVTDLCGMEDALTANGDEAVHRMEQVWELFRGAVSAEHAERRQALLEEADIQMDELCGCLDPEAEVEDGKQLLTWGKDSGIYWKADPDLEIHFLSADEDYFYALLESVPEEMIRETQDPLLRQIFKQFALSLGEETSARLVKVKFK